MKIRLLSIFLLLIPFQLFAADKWTSVHSANFTLVGNATESQLRSVAVDLEQFRYAFTQTLGLATKPAGVSTTVVVLKNDESFRPFSLSPSAANTAAAAGYFQASEDVNYMAVEAGVTIPRSVYHQYSHELMRDLPNTIPLWLSEGMAEFFSNFEVLSKEKQFTVGKPISEHADVLRKGPLMPLDELFAVDRSSPLYNERERTGMYHAESWALVNYLLVGMDANRQAAVGEFMKLVVSGRPTGESFQAAFKTDSASILRELEGYVTKTAPRLRATSLKDKGAIDAEIKVHALTEAEAEFYSGDLLLHVTKLPDAATHLQQAMKLDPKLASAQAALGMLFYREDRSEEAIDYLKKAIELDPKNYLSQYYYAYVLDKNTTSPLDKLDEKRAALGKAIELMPQFPAAYELLAYINLTADIDYDTTIDLLRNANKYAPSDQNIRLLFAQVLVKKKELDQAEKTLQALLGETTLDASTRDGVQNLLNYISRTREAENKQFVEETAAARREDEAARQAAEKRAAEQQAAAAVAATARPKNGELVAVTPKKSRPEGTQIKGALTLVDCRGGLTLTIKAGTETVVLHTNTPDKIEFVSYTSSINTSISCGPTRGDGIQVLVTYRPTPGAATAGEPLVVEFVEN